MTHTAPPYRPAIYLGGVTALLLVSTACGTTGELGTFTFFDGTRHADAIALSNLSNAAAVGAELPLVVRSGDTPVNVVDATFIEGDAFSVIQTANPIGLRAETAGTSRVEVTARDGSFDRVAVRAAELGSVELRPHGPGALLRYANHEAPIALLPGAEIGVMAVMRDAEGSRLTGRGLLSFEVDDDLAANPFAEHDHAAWIRHEATDLRSTTVTTNRGGGLSVELLGADHPTELRVELATDDADADEARDAEPPDSAPEGGSLQVLRITLTDSEERYILAPGEPTWEVTEGPNDLVVSPDDRESWTLLREPGLLLLGACPGSGTVRFTWGEATADLPLTVAGEAEGCAE